VLSQAPIAKELYTAYILADALNKNWSLIAQLYDIYEKKGWQGVTNVIGNDVIHNALFSVQTDIAWVAIKSFIPKEYHSKGKWILTNIMEQITSEEVKLIKQFLQQGENRKSLMDSSYENTQGQLTRFPKTRRMPKEIRYV
jgi:NADPH:quinone reductase-like Zn-dependent oxidoreductase